MTPRAGRRRRQPQHICKYDVIVLKPIDYTLYAPLPRITIIITPMIEIFPRDDA